MSETSDVTTPAIAAINRLPQTRAWRINSGKVAVRGGWLHLAPEGFPDIGITRRGRSAFCECKRSAKEKMRAAQLTVADELRAAGAFVFRANSAAEAVEILLREIP